MIEIDGILYDATVEAESVDQAERMAFEYDLIWKEYDGDYHSQVEVEEIDNDDA